MYQPISTSAVSRHWADGGSESNTARDTALCPPLLCKPLVTGTHLGCWQLLRLPSPRFRSPPQLCAQTLKATVKQSHWISQISLCKTTEQEDKMVCKHQPSRNQKYFLLSWTPHRQEPSSQRHLPREVQGLNGQITPSLGQASLSTPDCVRDRIRPWKWLRTALLQEGKPLRHNVRICTTTTTCVKMQRIHIAQRLLSAAQQWQTAAQTGLFCDMAAKKLTTFGNQSGKENTTDVTGPLLP